MLQNPRIEKRYEHLYGVLLPVLRAIVQQAKGGDPRETYERMKYLSFGSAVVATTPDLARSVTTWEDFVLCCDSLAAQKATWFEDSIPRRGNQGEYEQAFAHVVAQTLREFAPPYSDAVIDLGSGWGTRAIDLWLADGPRTATYVGYERSASGRSCADVAAALFPALNFTTLPFDFTAPDFSKLPLMGMERNLTVFSVHGLEQVPILDQDFLDRLLQRSGMASLTGIHLEPITSQMPGEIVVNPDRFQRDRRYAQEKGFNLDLFAQLSRHPRIEITQTRSGVFDGGEGNSTSVVVWRKRY